MNGFKIFTKSKNSFEGQLPEEKTLAVVRMHWFTLVPVGIGLLVFLVLLILMFLGAPRVFGGLLLRFVWFTLSLGLLFWWYGLFFMVTMYFLNIWIVTDHRIIESRQLGLFRRNYTEINLSKIQEVGVKVEGFYNTMLNFGNIEVQSAAEGNKFLMANVANPMEIKEEIIKASHQQG